MKIFYLRITKVVALYLTVTLFFGCEKEEEPPPEIVNEPCTNLPQFVDDEHEEAFDKKGSSCISNSIYSDNQVGTATLIESPEQPNCSVPDLHFFKLHLGNTDSYYPQRTFDIDIYFLDNQPIVAGVQYDLSEGWINGYYTYLKEEETITTKITSGYLTLAETDEADLFGNINIESSPFEIEENDNSSAIGEGEFEQNGKKITLEGNFLAVDLGVSCGG